MFQIILFSGYLFDCIHISWSTKHTYTLQKSIETKEKQLAELEELIEKLDKLLNQKRNDHELLKKDLDELRYPLKYDLGVDYMPVSKVDYLKISLIWNPLAGMNKDIKHSKKHFYINGLWPSNIQSKDPQYCESQRQNEKWDKSKLLNRDELNDLWPCLDTDNCNDATNDDYWRKQWEKYGTCTIELQYFGSINDYFTNAQRIFEKLNINTMLQNNKFIQPSNSIPIDKSRLINALAPFYLVIKDDPARYFELICRQDEKLDYPYLSEVRYCFDSSYFAKHIKCPTKSDDSCGTQGKIFLLKPSWFRKKQTSVSNPLDKFKNSMSQFKPRSFKSMTIKTSNN